MFQSLGRDSVGLDRLLHDFVMYQSGFQSLGRDSVGLDRGYTSLLTFPFPFQSLGRDSVGLDHTHRIPTTHDHHVSIPRSGFCWFGPRPP